MTIIGLARRASQRAQRGDDARGREAPPTPVEARILALRATGGPRRAPATAASATHPAARRRGGRTSTSILRWSLMLATAAVVAAATFVIDAGGRAVPIASVGSTQIGSGTGQIPIKVAAGDVTLRVSVRSDAVPWFWCLESTRALPLEQHLCGNSGEPGQAGSLVVTSGDVRLDAAEVDGASFFIQTYCPNSCDWQAVASVHR